jgi:hypothetical protein
MNHRSIWKFRLNVDHQTIDIEARIVEWLHVGLDPNGTPCAWAIVDQFSRLHHRYALEVVGTGQSAPSAPYIGSFVEGPFVWHVFAKGEM